MSSSKDEDFRAGFVAIGGRTNVGKSTLLNRLVGHKVAIVTPLPQTTRRRIVGIRNEAGAQMILIDTPGIHEPRRLLNRRMMAVARRSLTEGEVIIAVVEAQAKLAGGDRAFLDDLRGAQAKRIVVVNKIDLVSRQKLLPFLQQCQAQVPEAEIVPVSALTGANIDELVLTIKQMLPVRPALMPADEYTDQTERALVEELIREKVFLAMRQEIPFSSAVKVEQFIEEPERRLIRITALVIVERDSHKGMVIGAGGAKLKEIGTAARMDIEELLGARVFLELVAKVEKDWTRNPRKLTELGL
ncbi:MAG: GTPase Era [Candidatus Binataceae bacterium]|nr:GTPase Era [Candidatus Binataceae bacterium]